MSRAASLRTGAEVLEALRDQPGGPQLLELADGRGDVELVGGAVRDLLLGGTPRELDVVVADDAAAFANELAHRLNALAGQGATESFQSSSHERFRTALVWWDGSRIDVATRRSERYPQPGALPEVLEGTPEEDLRRRDFTVNAIALSLGGAHRGELRAVPSALEDLSAGRLRVLHDDSFIDDPTRLLRLARYRARLGFTIEEHTAGLVAAAVRARALKTVSLARLGVELRLALSEPDIVGAIASMEDLGLLRALDSQLTFDEPVTRHALTLLAEADGDTRPDLVLLTSLFTLGGYPIDYEGEEQDREQAMWLLDELEFLATERDLVVKALADGPDIAFGLLRAKTPSDIHKAATRSSLEAVALIGALGAVFAQSKDCAITQGARRWLTELRRVRLLITGDDLLAAGVPQGPEVGRRLEAALRTKLDGELDGEGREAELRAALEAQP
jgi:tRNA nucleotidyltransferase (CCA-adding enzyme)